MFLVKDRRLGKDNYVFTQDDPRRDGYTGDVVEGVTLDYDMNAIHLWPYGERRPSPQLGQGDSDHKNYRVFKFPEELQAAGFKAVHRGTPFVEYSWADYRRNYYPAPEEYAAKMTQDEWFDFLEETDSATKIRKKLSNPDRPDRGSTRDQVAGWVAKSHMAADGGIQQVWLLPSESPADELRLLEVSDRFTGGTAKVEPIDFGLDVGGAKYKLLVADVSTDQLGKIEAAPAVSLPSGWKIDGALVWGRRGRLR